MTSLILEPGLPDKRQLTKGISRRLGYEDLSQVPADIFDHTQQAIETAFDLARPMAVCKSLPVKGIFDHHIQAPGFKIKSPLWAGLAMKMEPPVSLALFALTLGSDLDQETARHQKTSLAFGYLLHEAGAALIETVADSLEEDLQQALGFENFKKTARFSPGYCDWPLDAQEMVFDVLTPGQIGIKATSAWSLFPAKSITAVILFAEKSPFVTPCPQCKKKKNARTEGGRNMSSAEICFMTATDLARHIREKTLSAREVMVARLEQIERVNPKVNASVTLLPEQTTGFWKHKPLVAE